MVGGLLMKRCKRQPPHPCDPPLPCDVCDDGEACPKPNLCVERIKNPQLAYETHCKPGNFLPATYCHNDPPHPCDPPPPCKPGKPRSLPCEPALCKERVKNLEDPFIRCPDPDDEFSHDLCEDLDMLKTPIPPCTSKDPCAPPTLKDPFEDEVEDVPQVVAKVEDPNEYLYSRELCKHLDMLKQTIKDCFSKPCAPPELKDPFMEEVEKYPEKKDPCDIDPREEMKKLRQARKEARKSQENK